jgi:hypothetical protein
MWVSKVEIRNLYKLAKTCTVLGKEYSPQHRRDCRDNKSNLSVLWVIRVNLSGSFCLWLSWAFREVVKTSWRAKYQEGNRRRLDYCLTGRQPFASVLRKLCISFARYGSERFKEWTFCHFSFSLLTTGVSVPKSGTFYLVIFSLRKQPRVRDVCACYPR